jgi:hypothetical protein
MTPTTITGLDLLRARMSGTIGARMPGHLQRLRWSWPTCPGCRS